MNEILEQRARELARFRNDKQAADRQLFLVAEWANSRWAFSTSDYQAVLAGPEIAAPAGTKAAGMRCTAFIRHEGQIVPVVDWSEIAGLEAEDESFFLVLRRIGLALRISSKSSLQRLEFDEASPSQRPGGLSEIGEVVLADIGVFQ